MKSFNLVRALEGDPIQTIGGLPARILCADLCTANRVACIEVAWEE